MGNTLKSERDGFVVQDLGEEIIIYDPEARLIHSLNDSAASIFRTLKRGAKREELVEMTVNEYKGDREAIKRDIEKCITDLTKKGLV
ncbi:MAG: PqqD family protein [Candidatus Brocadiales bacterium]